MITIRLSDIPEQAISDHDLAELAKWANKQKHLAFRDPQIAKSFAMIREAADTMLRERALQPRKVENPT